MYIALQADVAPPRLRGATVPPTDTRYTRTTILSPDNTILHTLSRVRGGWVRERERRRETCACRACSCRKPNARLGHAQSTLLATARLNRHQTCVIAAEIHWRSLQTIEGRGRPTPLAALQRRANRPVGARGGRTSSLPLIPTDRCVGPHQLADHD